MKKNALAGAAAVLAVAAGGYIGATAYTGHRIRAAIDERVDRVEMRLPLVRIVDRTVEKGLFSSTFIMGLRLGCARADPAPGAEAPPLVRLRAHVRHGPLPGLGFGAARIDWQLLLPEGAPAALRSVLAAMQPDDVRVEVGYGGDYRMAVRLPAGELPVEGGQLMWSEARLTGTGRLDGEAGAMEARLPRLRLRRDDARDDSFRMTDLRWQSVGRGPGLWMRRGAGTLRVGRIEAWRDVGGMPLSVQLSGISYKTEAHTEKDLLNGTIALRADASVRFGVDAEPFLIDNIELRESVKRLHVPTLRRWAAASMAGLSSCDPDGAGDSEGESGAERQIERAEAQAALLLHLLPHDPEFALDKLAMSHDGRRGELSYAIGVQDFAVEEAETAETVLPRLTQALTARAHAKLPAAWIEQVGMLGVRPGEAGRRGAELDAMLKTAIAEGYVVREGEEVSASIVFEHGAFSLNGKPLGPRTR